MNNIATRTKKVPIQELEQEMEKITGHFLFLRIIQVVPFGDSVTIIYEMKLTL